MPFKLSESEDSDMVPTFELFANVFGGSAYFFQLFPHHETPVGRKIGAERLLAKKQEGRSKFLKVVDESTGEIAGCGTWIVYENATMLDDHFEAHCFQTNGDFWDTQESKEQAMHAIHEFAEFRKNNAIKLAHGNLLALDVLAVADKYQRQGVGRMIVKWGTALADKLGYMASVEGSTAGRGLYESEGFRTKYRVSITWPKKWAHLKEVDFYWMTRPSLGERDRKLVE